MFFKIVALIFILSNYIQYAQAAEKPILLQFDYSKPVRISGDNTTLFIKTDISQPPSVRILDHGGESCHIKVSIEEKEKGHSISLINEKKNWLSFSQCDPEVAINLPLNKKLDIKIDKIVVNIDGQYEEVEIDADNLVLNIDGQYEEVNIDAHDLFVTMDGQYTEVEIDADHLVVHIDGQYKEVDIDADDLVVHIDGQYKDVEINADEAVITAFFKDIKSNDKIFIIADKLVANLGFSKKSKLSYSIEAPVSVFSKKIPESYTDSAKIIIQAQVLQGSIFYK